MDTFWDCLCAGPALIIGMLTYGNLDEIYDLISKWDKDKIINAYLFTSIGFNTLSRLMGKDLLYCSNFVINSDPKKVHYLDNTQLKYIK